MSKSNHIHIYERIHLGQAVAKILKHGASGLQLVAVGSEPVTVRLNTLIEPSEGLVLNTCSSVHLWNSQSDELIPGQAYHSP